MATLFLPRCVGEVAYQNSTLFSCYSLWHLHSILSPCLCSGFMFLLLITSCLLCALLCYRGRIWKLSIVLMFLLMAPALSPLSLSLFCLHGLGVCLYSFCTYPMTLCFASLCCSGHISKLNNVLLLLPTAPALHPLLVCVLVSYSCW